MSVSAPAGGAADWTVRGALTQGDISSWIVAGSYTTRAPARHRYDIGLSYATQRYDGGNPAALRDVTDGSRNAGACTASTRSRSRRPCRSPTAAATRTTTTWRTAASSARASR